VPSSVHIDSNPDWGGGQAQSLGLALALATRGDETWFIAQPDSELLARLKGTYLSWEAMPLRGLAGLMSAPRLARRLAELKPDIIHIHESASHSVAGIAARRAGKSKIIVTRRTEFPLKRGWLGKAKYHLWCDKLICVSDAIRRRCLEAGLPDRLLAVIPDFVDCRHFDPCVGQGLAPTTAGPGRTIVAVGRLSAIKGHRVLLRAMAEVAKQAPAARLLICGAGEEEQALRALAQRLRLADRVTFAGFVNDVRNALAKADIFVMPSLSEGLGVAALEAMAMAKPVVLSDAGGLPESVIHGRTGLVVPAGDPGALASALIELLADPAKAAEMGRAARERMVEHFDRPRIVERVLTLYEELLTERR
jgi:glycosyltransferase involved in cell wall biosynthesis